MARSQNQTFWATCCPTWASTGATAASAGSSPPSSAMATTSCTSPRAPLRKPPSHGKAEHSPALQRLEAKLRGCITSKTAYSWSPESMYCVPFGGTCSPYWYSGKLHCPPHGLMLSLSMVCALGHPWGSFANCDCHVRQAEDIEPYIKENISTSVEVRTKISIILMIASLQGLPAHTESGRAYNADGPCHYIP